MKIAILDDWLDCAKQSADWDRLGADVAIDFFQDTVTGSTLIDRLHPYDVLCVMRERSMIDATLISQLPNLKAIVTSGMRNAAIDLDAAKARNITVCGTGSPGHATAELAFILIGMLARQILPSANDAW